MVTKQNCQWLPNTNYQRLNSIIQSFINNITYHYQRVTMINSILVSSSSSLFQDFPGATGASSSRNWRSRSSDSRTVFLNLKGWRSHRWIKELRYVPWIVVALWLCQNSSWKWLFIMDLPIQDGDFSVRHVELPEGMSHGCINGHATPIHWRYLPCT